MAVGESDFMFRRNRFQCNLCLLTLQAIYLVMQHLNNKIKIVEKFSISKSMVLNHNELHLTLFSFRKSRSTRSTDISASAET